MVAVAAVSPIYENEDTTWYWYVYGTNQSGFCKRIDQAQAEAERAVTGLTH
jgi:hypothetical protein